MKLKTPIQASFFILFVLIFTAVAMAADQNGMPPNIFDIAIVDYESSIVQTAGMSGTYEVVVENTGVMELSRIYLSSERIDVGWFSSEEEVGLSFGEKATLRYTLTLPEDAEGLYAFSVVAFGESGINALSDRVVVSLTAVPGHVEGPGITGDTDESPEQSVTDSTENVLTDMSAIKVGGLLIALVVVILFLRKLVSK